MIDFFEAREQIRKNCPTPSTDVHELPGSLGFILTEDVIAKDHSPLFDNSAMDGFAVIVSDVEQATPENPVMLFLKGTIQAGDQPEISLQKGEAIKIFTGAAIPPSTQAVVMREYVEESGDRIKVKRPVRIGENIRRQGEEYQPGEQIFPRGTLITPPVLGMLAHLGYTEIPVFRKPQVAVLITGNELVQPGEQPQPGQIRDSNSFTLSAMLDEMNNSAIEIKRVSDEETELRNAFSDSLQKADVLISVGGISMGDYDLVKSTVEDLGVSTVFWKVAMKPGKPNYFGILDKKLVFGLPGNPVSAAVSFHTLVCPALNKMSGIETDSEQLLQAKLLNFVRKKAGRLEFLRGKYYRNFNGELLVEPDKSQGSHMLTGLANANCLIYLPRDETEFKEGQIINIQPLQWSTL